MLSRRHFIKLAGSSAGLLLPACHNKTTKHLKSAHVVIIGGGFGGATAAKTIKKLDPGIQVTLIDPHKYYTSCPASNWVIAGLKPFSSLHFSHQTLKDIYGVKLIQAVVSHIDSVKQSIRLNSSEDIAYDRLIISPGIDFRWDTIQGHDQNSCAFIPHAWKAGEQTLLLKNQLMSMKNGGTVVICAPPNPFRCPPGPYERASLIAHYLKIHKPKSKLIIVDPKTQFSKQKLFINAWEKHYGYDTDNSMIEWVSIPDNPITHLDVKTKTITTDFGDQYKADVLNYIPAQKAAYIAQITGLTDNSGWCPIHHKTSESTLHPNIHIIGDAAAFKPLPKSAFAANSEAKMCAFAIVSLLNEMEIQQPSWINTCYSLVTPNQGISVAMVYKLNAKGQAEKVKGAGGLTAKNDEQTLSLEAQYAKQWFSHITDDSFN